MNAHFFNIKKFAFTIHMKKKGKKKDCEATLQCVLTNECTRRESTKSICEVQC